MKTWLKVLIVTVVITVPAFLAGPNAPLGGFWGVDPHGPQPTGGQMPLFMLLGLLEAIFLGLGVSFLFFGYPVVRDLAPGSPGLARLAHLSITWLLIQWWPHDSLHIVAGMDFTKLLAIDYGFHVPLMAASLILLAFLIVARRAASGVQEWQHEGPVPVGQNLTYQP